jgi:alkyl hydroperoxide reductase subunit AhpC
VQVGGSSCVSAGREIGYRFSLLADSNPEGAVARAYGAYPGHKDLSSRDLFVIDERGTIRWSRAYPGLVNPGIDGILLVLEPKGATEDAALCQTDERRHA